VALPLGISFFTFTQIGFLLDSREGAVRDGNLLNYVLFVTFFPHLIAGPILHHKEIMPQYQRDETYKLDGDGFARGYSLFIIGLFKKTAVADTFSVYANDGFANAASSSLFGAWGALLFYSLQLYFDFSGYSDMAIGIARMFGVKFPINFNSPYRATSIIEFWSRWHMTLTRYLNLYLYNPLAIWATRRIAARGKPINRKALAKPIPFAQVVVGPIVFTMFLAGIWHGAGLQFIIFGLLHAFYLVCNHAWRTFGPSKPKNAPAVPVWREWAATIGCVALTYFAVLIGQVFFRAPSTGVAFQLLAGMSGLHGVSFALPVPHSLPQQLGSLGAWLQGHGLIAPVDLLQDGTTPALSIVEMALAYLAVWLLPNSQTIVGISGPNIQDKRSAHTSETGRAMAFRPSTRWGLAMGLATAVALLEVGAQSEFLYFQF
jgi:D-alanyl-lipoteichoic acid acyltransferase DltB (MBOAT superfamily)